MVRHDNTFGTPEEDAFRRDFTINALFYDIGTFSIIDYVGGLEDLRRRVIRCIGDPLQRFPEDPVRMLRAVSFAARLDFTLDPPIVEAIRQQRHLMALASPARLIEEYYKILRSGAAERTFRGLAEHGLLEPVTPELQRRAAHEPLWDSLRALDTYRRRFTEMPPQLTNPVLLGSLLLPIGLMPRASAADEHEDALDEAEADVAVDAAPESDEGAGTRRRPRGRPWSTDRRDRRPKPPVLKIGILPIARRDTERLRQLLSVQPGSAIWSRHAAREARADASRAVRGCADMARHPRPRAGDRRALEGFIEALVAAGAPQPGSDAGRGRAPSG